MDIETGLYHGAENVAAQIWTLLATPKSIAEICEALNQSFEVDPAVCLADTSEFVEELHRRNLVKIL